jgi:hypothetical protein
MLLPELEQRRVCEHGYEFYEIAVIVTGKGWHASGEYLLRAQEGEVYAFGHSSLLGSK